MNKSPVKIYSLFQHNPYNRIFADVPVISELDVAYPFYVYSVLLPVGESEKTLNLFEETVLKMTDIVSGNSDMIAEKLCLSPDFVTFIQNKLKGLGFVDERYSITESGKAILTVGNESEKIEYVPVKIFVDPKTQGKISYVHSGEFSAESFSLNNYGYLTFKVGTEGRSKSINALTINPYEAKRPSLFPSELETIIRRYNRVRKNNSYKFRGLYCAFNEKADISDAPELFYVHLKLAIPDGNAEKIIISDGFSIDIDFLLSGISENPRAINDLKRKSVKETEFVIQKITESKYGELYHHWNGKNGVNSIFSELKNLTRDTSDSKKKYAEKYATFARNIYGALEWCFYYALKEQTSFSELIASLASTAPGTNQHRLITAANSIGINVAEANINLLSVNNLGVNNIADGTPDMFSCVAMMLISENENNANFQMVDRILKDYISDICKDASEDDAHINESFVLQYNNIIDFIADLKRKRDATSHGIDENEIPQFSDLEDIYEIVSKTISVILPAFTSDKDANGDVGNVSQERVKAIYALEEEWGVVEFRTISPEIREMLIRLEFIREEYNDSRSGEYVIQLSKIAEFSLSQAIKEIKHDYDDEFEMKETAFARIKKCSGENLNVAIANVRDRFIRLALRGSTKSTLGAYLISYFAYARDDDIDKVNSACNSAFVQTMVKIIALRGHANKLFIKASPEELDKLRENLVKIVSSL